MLLTAVVIGFAGATLGRLGPGFGLNEREMDSRLGHDSRPAIEVERVSERDILSYYAGYWRGLIHGDYTRALLRALHGVFRMDSAERIA